MYCNIMVEQIIPMLKKPKYYTRNVQYIVGINSNIPRFVMVTYFVNFAIKPKLYCIINASSTYIDHFTILLGLIYCSHHTFISNN